MGREKVHMVLFGNLLNNPLDVLYGSVAQLVEQGIENPRVIGSIPT